MFYVVVCCGNLYDQTSSTLLRIWYCGLWKYTLYVYLYILHSNRLVRITQRKKCEYSDKIKQRLQSTNSEHKNYSNKNKRTKTNEPKLVWWAYALCISNNQLCIFICQMADLNDFSNEEKKSHAEHDNTILDNKLKLN